MNVASETDCMSVLVTGAGGFIGSHLAEAVASEGAQVTGIVHADRQDHLLDPDAVDIVRGDLSDPATADSIVDGHDRVFHTAARLTAGDDGTGFYQDNVLATRNVMRAAAENGVERVVFTSSKVTFGMPSDGRLDSTVRPEGRFPSRYALSKYKAEKIAFEYGAQGLDVTSVNPTLVYGPRETHTLGPLIRWYLKMPVGLYGFGDTLFDLVYIDDVVAAHRAAMERGAPGRRYLVSGEQVSLRAFLDAVDRAAGRDVPRLEIPGPLVRLALVLQRQLPSAGPSLPLTHEQLYALTRSTETDPGDMVDELGCERTGLDEGLEETVAWYRDQGYLTGRAGGP